MNYENNEKFLFGQDFKLLNPTSSQILTLSMSTSASVRIQIGREKSLLVHIHVSRLVGKPTMWFPTRSDTNRPVHLQKRARILKFLI